MVIFNMIKKYFFRLYRFIVYTRPIYTIWFNFRYLPYVQAKALPIIFFPHAFAKVEKGAKIILGANVFNGKNNKVFVGEDARDFAHFSEKTYIHVAGVIQFTGKTHILRGAFVEALGQISFGQDVLVCSLARIRSYNKIVIGDHVRITHETQMFDTNFHYVVDVEHPEFRRMSKPIIIGDYVWIGNRSTVNGGGVIPSHTIVASNSLANKDMSTINPYTIIGGIPCKVLAEGKTRVWDDQLEAKYFQQEFGYTIPPTIPVIW